MIKLKSLAIIPAKGKSTRLPNKNTLDFCGKPLIMQSLKSVMDARHIFNEFHVSTDDQNIADMVSEVPCFKPKFLRPSRLASDDSTLAQVCEFVLGEYRNRGVEFETFCLLWPTAPLRTAQDIVSGYEMLDDDCDAVVAVSAYDLPIYCAQEWGDNGLLNPVFPNAIRKSSQELPESVCDIGSFAWVRAKEFVEQGTWLPSNTKGYLVPKYRAIDIDTLADFRLAEFWYSQIERENKPN